MADGLAESFPLVLFALGALFLVIKLRADHMKWQAVESAVGLFARHLSRRKAAEEQRPRRHGRRGHNLRSSSAARRKGSAAPAKQAPEEILGSLDRRVGDVVAVLQEVVSALRAPSRAPCEQEATEGSSGAAASEPCSVEHEVSGEELAARPQAEAAEVAGLRAALAAAEEENQRLSRELEEARNAAEEAQEALAEAPAAQAQFEGLITALRQQCSCPIMHSLFRDPVVATDGHTYERREFQQWVMSGRGTSPLTNVRLRNGTFIPNNFARQMVSLLREHGGQLAGSSVPSEVGASIRGNEPDQPLSREFLEHVVNNRREAVVQTLRIGNACFEAPLELQDCITSGWFLAPRYIYEFRFVPGSFALHLAAARGWADICRIALELPGALEISRRRVRVEKRYRNGVMEQDEVSIRKCAALSGNGATQLLFEPWPW